MRGFGGALAILALAGCIGGPVDALVLGTTTSVQDTGLLDVLLPAFHAATRVHVRAVVGGTGETLARAERGDVDVLLTHSPNREADLVARGVAAHRRPVMFNRFVVAGPSDDPAHVREARDAVDAFRRIHDNETPFLSRGDRSGTHDRELEIWDAAGLPPENLSRQWYRETGTGQGATLIVADETRGYLLLDEGTLLQFHSHRRAAATVALCTDGPLLRNEYAVLEVNPDAVPGAIRTDAARRFADWITSDDGQRIIRDYTIDGVPVFTPDAHPAED